jgi:hypothetical protein
MHSNSRTRAATVRSGRSRRQLLADSMVSVETAVWLTRVAAVPVWRCGGLRVRHLPTVLRAPHDLLRRVWCGRQLVWQRHNDTASGQHRRVTSGAMRCAQARGSHTAAATVTVTAPAAAAARTTAGTRTASSRVAAARTAAARAAAATPCALVAAVCQQRRQEQHAELVALDVHCAPGQG